MDNLAHSLVGLAAAKAGLDRLSPGATTLCVLAANAPDIDVVSAFSGKASFLHYHRGITHSIAGTLCLGVLLPVIYWAAGFVIARVRRRAPTLRFRGLLVASLIVIATHPVMDWSGDYGIRPLLPWNGRWSYGDFAFIVDPFFWLIMGGAAFLLSSDRLLKQIAWAALALLLTTLIVLVIRAGGEFAHPVALQVTWIIVILALVAVRAFHLHIRFGRTVALASFAIIGLYWCALGYAHHRAYVQATNVATQIAAQENERLVRQAVTATQVNPFRWQGVVETDRAIYRFVVNIREGAVVPGGQSKVGRVITVKGLAAGVWRFAKPDDGEARLISLAARDPQAQMFLEFARFPFARVRDSECVSQTLVAFGDLRYNLRSMEQGTPRGTFWVDVPLDCPQK